MSPGNRHNNWGGLTERVETFVLALPILRRSTLSCSGLSGIGLHLAFEAVGIGPFAGQHPGQFLDQGEDLDVFQNDLIILCSL